MVEYNKIKKLVSKEEKIERVKEFNKFAKDFNAPLFENEEEFINSAIYDETILMHCNKCHYEEEMEAEIAEEIMEMEGQEYPELCCPECSEGVFIPKDIYLKKNIK